MHDIRLLKNQLLKYQSSPNTIWTHYNVLVSFMAFSKDKRLNRLKELKLPKIPNKYMPIFSKKYLLNKTKDLTNYKNVLIRFLFETGMRVSELKKIIEIKKNTLFSPRKRK